MPATVPMGVNRRPEDLGIDEIARHFGGPLYV
jgi:hypothetical protein